MTANVTSETSRAPKGSQSQVRAKACTSGIRPLSRIPAEWDGVDKGTDRSPLGGRATDWTWTEGAGGSRGDPRAEAQAKLEKLDSKFQLVQFLLSY